MSIIESYYQKIKNLITEYETILELDKEYMTEYLQHCGKDLNKQNPEVIDNIQQTQIFTQTKFINDEIFCTKNIADSISKLFYKPLAKLLHPDKKKKKKKSIINEDDENMETDENEENNDFIKLNSAYESNDYLTLFLFYYENKIDVDITDEIIKILDIEIQKKMQEIQKIKSTIYWQWNNSDDMQKQLIQEFVKTQL